MTNPEPTVETGERCPDCGRTPLARGYERSYGRCDNVYGDGQCQTLTIARLRSELADAIDRRKHTEQWYAERCERLWHWAHADKEHRGEYFSIISNGTVDAFEPPTYGQLLNDAKWRAEKAESELSTLRARDQLESAVVEAASEWRRWMLATEGDEMVELCEMLRVVAAVDALLAHRALKGKDGNR